MSELSPIDQILARLRASTAAGVPPVNPSVAPTVLDTATRAEVANSPALDAAFFTSAAEREATTRPLADTIAKMKEDPLADAIAKMKETAAAKTRRTAAVVQQELDAALARIAELEASGDAPASIQETTDYLVDRLIERGYQVQLCKAN